MQHDITHVYDQPAINNNTECNIMEYTNFLHFSQLYMLSPFKSSAEKKAARQSCSVITGPQSQLNMK